MLGVTRTKMDDGALAPSSFFVLVRKIMFEFQFVRMTHRSILEASRMAAHSLFFFFGLHAGESMGTRMGWVLA